ncbi:efflux RND transporter periplasmic adaptor subunit [Alkaliphilus crotonatoxidans]
MKNKKKKMIVLLIAVVVLASLSFMAVRSSKASNQGVFAEVMTVEKKDIAVKIPATGTLEELEKASIFYEGTGKVAEIKVEVGQFVKKGEILASLDESEFGNKLNIASTQLEMERLNLAKLEKSRKEAMEKARKSLESTQLQHERNMALFESGGLSQAELEKSQDALEELQTTYQQYQNNEDSLYFEIQHTKKQIEVSQLNIDDLTKEQTRLGGIITSPIDGVITAVNIDRGTVVSPTSPCFVVSNLDQLEIKINVNEYDIARVEVGQQVEIETDALTGTVFEGTVEKIAPVASKLSTGQTTETAVEVTIKVMERHEMLKPGFSVKTRIISDKRENTLVVPFDSIQIQPDGKKLVYIVKEDGTAAAKEVQTGIESDFEVEITQGIEAGQTIILRPGASLKDGDRVIIR